MVTFPNTELAVLALKEQGSSCVCKRDEKQFLKDARGWVMTDYIAVANSEKKNKFTYPQRYTSKFSHISCLFINQ